MAGEVDSTTHTPFAPGTKAMQFRIGPNFSLKSFQGSLISYQKQLTAKKARRIGISISTDLKKDDNLLKDERYNLSDSNYTTVKYTGSKVDNSLNLSISYQIIKNESFRSGFFLYWGFGPILKFDRKKYHIFKLGEDSHDKYLTTNIQLGLASVVGVEWFIKENMSLLAEYDPIMLAGYEHNENHFEEHYPSGVYQKRDVTSEGSSFSISSDVKLGISIYLTR
jgi:hypothetical protein